ncbi:aldehyde dehydrogenase family protein [Gordonia amarae]|mgnify:FL=1|uniref:Aldehyde dehydrogenase n=2 Tax=Gordonia amarae TaxID=36821 RepID=G7GW31_9ACTN|nr:aldehyde dehydrogenase family protein [Gordonia amarae]MCS3880539.1 coniferyl-aldehyde dehydrogenase [Gordonia amarae]QHN18866.1 aldehyde dehydrogenase family protein [Gordonia amarae]QHN23341.1 aldehyde dehydrogenase family protein [Gordonia amarae]QHN32241.1 aldehyde dehydrogenase family protein [Gordonia amarae]QHN40989.1 aldehyde dehydrogenase family protein [Gordonia amarae]
MTKPAEITTTDTHVSSDQHTMTELLEIQRAAFLRDGIPDAKTRIDRIARLAALLLDHSDEIAEALTADFGSRPRELSLAADVAGCMIDLAHQRRSVTKWMKETKTSRAMGVAGFKQSIRHDPLGVVGIMGPWNFPLQLTIVPAGSAFAAGNRVLMRPSSITAKTTDVIAKYAPDYFSIEEFAVITSRHGSGSDFAKLKVDHMFFTGSPEVGASVAAEAGKNLVPVTLELGGKNPVVVDSDEDIAKAAKFVANARMVNGGQVCLCPDYVFVPEAKVDEFVDGVIARWTEIFPSIVDNPQYTATINEKNYNRIVGLIDDAVSLGATKREVVPAGEQLPDAGTRKIAPTVLTGVKAGMKIEEDEVFGPVLTVYPYRSLSEAIGHISANPHPLNMYWCGDRNERFERLADGTRSGAINGNDFALHLFGPELPFGGVGRSGMGGYHGKTGFDTFSHRRAVAFSSMPVSIAEMMSPPFVKRDTKMADGQIAMWRKLNTRALKKARKK